MQKAMVWTIALALVWGGVLATPVNAEEKISIHVERNRIDDPNKDRTPIPEFPWREHFAVEVTFIEPSEDLNLTLSDFKIVSYDPDAKGTKENPHWTHKDIAMEMQDENGVSIQEISFSSSEGTREILKTESGEETTVYRVGKNVKFLKDKEVRGLNLHVVFKQTLSQVLFEIDPPWAGRPPSG